MSFIKETALSLGFDACGIAKADELADDALLMQNWLAFGNNGDMHYLERNTEKRYDPRKLVPGCKSIVVLLLNYFPEEIQNSTAPQIAKYAYSEIDYHIVIKSKLNDLEKRICDKFGTESVSKSHQHLFVDSAPVLERRWAERAGLGWIGKNKQLIHPGLGSYVFIGILMLNIELEYDSPIKPRCGSCTRCIDACPTNALSNYSLDARKCISYLTIESKSDIPYEFHSKLSNRVYGCDICADICPWNAKWKKSNTHSELNPVSEILNWRSEKWLHFSEADFNSKFKNSALQRAGYKKFKNNLSILTDKSKLL